MLPRSCHADAPGRPRYRHLRPKILRVPPFLEIAGERLTAAAFIGATENVMRRYQLEVLVVDEMAEDPAPNSWALDCTVGETPGLLRAAIDRSQSWSQVIAYVIGRRDEMRAELDDREREIARRRAEDEPTHIESAAALKAIVQRIADS